MLERGYTETLHPTRWRSIALALALALLAFLAANALVGRYLDRYGTNLGYVYVAHKWRVLGQLSRPVDWLVLGDSTVNQSFDPARLREREGLRAVNLGTIGNFGAIDDLWMLEEYLERFGPPEAVVVVHTYDVFHRRPPRMLFGRVPRWRPLTRETAREYRISREGRLKILQTRFLRLHSERTSIRNSMRFAYLRRARSEEEFAALRVSDHDIPLEDPELHDDGFVRMCGAIPEAVERDFRGHVKFVSARGFGFSAENRAALARMMELAEAHEFELFIVTGPIYNKLAGLQGFRRYLQQEQQALRELAGDRQRVHVIEGARPFAIEQLQNADHVTCEAAPLFTDWLIDQVKRAAPAR